MNNNEFFATKTTFFENKDFNQNYQKSEEEKREMVSYDFFIKNDNAKYQIPAYQRPYSWTQENVETLINDILFVMKDESREWNNYFIGNIILMNRKSGEITVTSNYEVIDGQQRLTTSLLIFKWLINYTLKYKNEIDNEQFKTIKKYNDGITDFFKKIEHATIDSSVFKYFISFDTNEKIIKLRKKNFIKDVLDQKTNNFAEKQFKVFLDVYKRIDKVLKSKSISEIIEFYNFFATKTVFLRIVSSPYDNMGDLLFLSINGKGLSLSKSDIIKSYFVQIYTNDQQTLEKFKKLWAGLINDSCNKLESTIVGYYQSKYKTKLGSKGWVEKIKNIEDKNGLTIKSDFEGLCRYVRDVAPLNNMTIEHNNIKFWLKLFNNFGWTKYLTTLCPLIINECTDETNNSSFFENNLNRKRFAEILEYLFKLHFLYMGIETNPNGIFQKEIITKSIEQINYFSDKKLDILKYFIKWLKDEYSKLLEVKIDDINNFDFSKVKYIKRWNPFIKLLFLYCKDDTFNTNTWQINYTTAFTRLDSWTSIDHIIPKTGSKFYSEESDENNKKNHKYIFIRNKDTSTYKLNEEVFDDEMKNRFGFESDEISQARYNDFLNSLWNLEPLEKSDNSTKHNKALSLSRVKKILSKDWITEKKSDMKSGLYRFLDLSNLQTKNLKHIYDTVLTHAHNYIEYNYTHKNSKIKEIVDSYCKTTTINNLNEDKIFDILKESSIFGKKQCQFLKESGKKIQNEYRNSRDWNLNSEKSDKMYEILNKIVKY